jgi:hypothetical protein
MNTRPRPQPSFTLRRTIGAAAGVKVCLSPSRLRIHDGTSATLRKRNASCGGPAFLSPTCLIAELLEIPRTVIRRTGYGIDPPLHHEYRGSEWQSPRQQVRRRVASTRPLWNAPHTRRAIGFDFVLHDGLFHSLDERTGAPGKRT